MRRVRVGGQRRGAARRGQGGVKEGARRGQGGAKEGPRRGQGGAKEGPRRGQGGANAKAPAGSTRRGLGVKPVWWSPHGERHNEAPARTAWDRRYSPKASGRARGTHATPTPLL